MSYYAVIPSPVLHDAGLSDGAKVLYGHIAVLASKSGECFATREHLAAKMGAAKRTVSRQVAELIERGHIIAQDDLTKKATRVLVLATGFDFLGKAPIAVDGNHINTRDTIKRDKSKDDLDGFDTFWDAYPHKKGKRQAMAAWKKMGKAERGLAISFLPTYVAAVRKQGIEFKYGSTYLRSAPWDDEGYSEGGGNHKPVEYGVMLDMVARSGKLTTADFESVEYGGEKLWRLRDKT